MSRSRWLSVALFLVAGVALAAIGAGRLWSTYMAYDDEGYVLHTLKEYAAGGGLYDRVFTQYGPAFYVVFRGLAALGLVFTTESARALTLACWVVAAAACALVVWRGTRGALVPTLFALVATFLHLMPLTSEPSHPGGLCVLLVALAALLGSGTASWTPWRGAALGATVATLALTKINVGAFAFLAIAWYAALSRSGAQRRPAALLAGAFGLALGLALMRPLLTEPSFRVFAVVFGAALLTVTAAGAGAPPAPTRRFTFAFCAAAAGLVVMTGIVVLATGTSWAGLLDGALLGPLRHPTNYSFGFNWKPGTLALAGLGAVAALAWLRPTPRWAVTAVEVARLTAVAGYVAAALGLLPFTPAGYVLSYGVLTAWLFVVRTEDEDPAFQVRLWLAALLVLQSLHAYPVAGSQVSWGTFLWLPLAALGCHASLARHRGALRIATVGTMAAAILAMTVVHARTSARYYGEGQRLGLPTAASLRLPEDYGSALRLMSDNARQHGAGLFTLPGMMSFHAWTGLPPPTSANTTHWFNLLSAAQQAEILDALQRSPRTVMIVQRYILDTAARKNGLGNHALIRFVLQNYERRFTADSYEFWTRREYPVTPMNVARVLRAEPGSGVQLEIVVPEILARQAVSFELREFAGDGSRSVATWTPDEAQVARDALPAVAAPDIRFAVPLATLRLRPQRWPDRLNPKRGIIYLRNSAGDRIGEARLID